MPSVAPTGQPSVSFKPSLSPSESPSAAPSESPTGSLYYPDWENDSQVCVNDGGEFNIIRTSSSIFSIRIDWYTN